MFRILTIDVELHKIHTMENKYVVSLWHRRFGHLYEALGNIKKLPRLVIGMECIVRTSGSVGYCESYVQGKAHKKPISKNLEIKNEDL